MRKVFFMPDSLKAECQRGVTGLSADCHVNRLAGHAPGKALGEPPVEAGQVLRLTDWIAQGQVRPLVSQTRSLEDGPRALRDLLERRVTGKVVLIP